MKLLTIIVTHFNRNTKRDVSLELIISLFTRFSFTKDL